MLMIENTKISQISEHSLEQGTQFLKISDIYYEVSVKRFNEIVRKTK